MAHKADQDNPSKTLDTSNTAQGLTEANKQKILDIIDHQFDLEIYLKHREVATIRKEIENAEATLQDLELAIKNESLAATLPDLPHFTRQSAAALYYGHVTPSSSSTSSSSGTGMARKKAPKPTSNQKSVLYGRRIDGVYVRLACPVCHRESFSTQLGLLNHCRISHSLEFGFYENIMAQCGTPIDESEVPLDHPIRNRPLTLPVVPTATPKKMERPTIKEYEEDVDLELEQDGSTAKRKKIALEATDQQQDTLLGTEATKDNELMMETTAAETSPHAPPANLDSTSTALSTPINVPSESPSLPSSPMLTTTLDHQPTALNTTLNDKLISLSKELSDMDTSTNVANDITKPPILSSPSPPPPSSSIDAQSIIEASPINAAAPPPPSTENEVSASVPLTPVSEIPDGSKSESLTSAIVEKGSRFYIKRRIIVGNVSKFIPPEKRDPTLKNYTHKWMIYVVEPPQDQDKVPFLTGVRYHLHPSYKPYNVVDVTESPFRLTRLGWGEFPIRLQLYFVDKRRNKSLDVIHHLKLDYTLSGRQTLGNERSFDIELDRNTNFQDLTSIPTTTETSEVPSPPPVLQQQQQSASSSTASPTTTTTSTLNLNPMTITPTTPSLPLDADLQPQQQPLISTSKQRLILLQGILKECVQQYPIVMRAGSQLHQSVPILPLPYTCARNNQHFLTLPLAKRKSLEWHRAHLLRLLVQQRCRETNDTILRLAGDGLGTKEVVQWCRAQNFTPTLSSPSDSADNSVISPPAVNTSQPQEETRDWCRYCGCEAHSTLDCTHKPKGWRKRMVLGEQHTLSNAQSLLTSLGLDVQQQQQEQQQKKPHPTYDTMNVVAIDDDDDDDLEVEVDVSQPSSYIPNNNNNNSSNISTSLGKPSSSSAETPVNPSSSSTTTVVTTTTEPHQTLVQLIRETGLEGSMDDRALDWVWSVVAQLRLKRMIGHDLTIARNGQLQFQRPVEPEVNQDTAMEQRLVVGNLFVQLTKIFLKKILKGGVAMWQKEREQDGDTISSDKSSKLLVPYHIHQAMQQMTVMDFLTNAYMGTLKHDQEDSHSCIPNHP